MSFKFIVTINDVEQMRGGLTQATLFLISRYGNLDDGISAGARILPEWLTPPKPASHSASAAFMHRPLRNPAKLPIAAPIIEERHGSKPC
ncbi:MAG: hypothetical protein WC073_14210 [Sterolibacterium sp.]